MSTFSQGSKRRSPFVFGSKLGEVKDPDLAVGPLQWNPESNSQGVDESWVPIPIGCCEFLKSDLLKRLRMSLWFPCKTLSPKEQTPTKSAAPTTCKYAGSYLEYNYSMMKCNVDLNHARAPVFSSDQGVIECDELPIF